MGENLKVFWAKLSTLSLTVFILSVIAWQTQACPHLELKIQLRFFSSSSMTEVKIKEEWGLGVEFKLPQPNIFVIFLFIMTSTRVQN
jgi:hypothetical protein